jgi:hypothetical protein
LLVCKGNKVKYLAVKKKPVKKNELNEAKKSGYKGEGYFGVITGKGMELVFNLSTADGYTAEPVKDKILKDFLEEKANFKCKPTIVIVATLPDIPFDDEDLANPLIARFLALGERISQVLDARPDSETELTKTVSEIRLLLQDGDFQTAEPLVAALETRLQELLSSAQANSPAPPAPPQAVDNDALKLKLQEALNKLVPQLKQAVVTYPDKKVELLTPVAQIKKQMDAGELQEAKQGILAVGQLLKSVMAQGGTQPQAQPGTDLHADMFKARMTALIPKIKEAAASGNPAAQDIKLKASESGVFASKKDFARANLLLDEVEVLLQSPATQPATTSATDASATAESTDPSFVNMQRSRLAWVQTRQTVKAELTKLEDSILAEFKSEPDFADIQRDVRRLDAVLTVLDEELVDLLDAALNAADPVERKRLQLAAREQVQAYRDYVASDSFVAELDANPFTPVSIREIVTRSLTMLDKSLV